MPEIAALTAESESLIARFEAAWLGGNRPNVLLALEPCIAQDRSLLLRELIHADLEFRLKAGEEASTEDYVRQFPELAQDQSNAIRELIESEVRLRRRFGRPPIPDQLKDRFPDIFPISHETESSAVDQTITSLTAKSNEVEFASILSKPGASENKKIGQYVVQGQLGAGGMGIVFRALDPKLNRPVALKVMRPELAADPMARARFLREAESQAAVEHEYIVPIYQIGENEGVPFLAMPLLKGESLETRFQSGKPLPLPTVVQIALQLAEGLAAAHAGGLIHRDVKPSNVWLETDSIGQFRRARLLDFGLARRDSGETALTGTGVAIGTPAYMAPEQARGNADQRSDLFSFGCVLYQMATGRRPFQGNNIVAVVAAIATDIPLSVKVNSPTVPDKLADLIDRLLSKDPSNRPASAAEVAAELVIVTAALAKRGLVAETQSVMNATTEQDLQKQIVVDPTDTPQPSRWSQPKFRKWMRIVFASVAITLLGGFVLFAGTIIRIATNKGELFIETTDADVEVTVKGDNVIVYDKVKDRRFVLTAGEYEVEVREGGDGGLRFETKRFSITRGGVETFKAVLQPKVRAPDGKAPDPAPKLSIPKEKVTPIVETTEKIGNEQKAAEWVLSLGGKIRIFSAGQLVEIAATKDLPREDWQLIEVNLGGIYENEGGNPNVTDVGLAHLRGLPNLTALGLNGTLVTDAGLEHLQALPNLRSLGLNDTAVSDAGLAHLKNLTKLRNLHLTSDQRVTGTGLRHLQGLANLIELHLSCSRLDDAGLEFVKMMKNLRVLSIGSTRVTNAGLNHLKDLSSLTEIILDHNQVSDDGLAHLKNLSQLNNLGLIGAKVSDDGLVHLKTLSNLTKLVLNENKGITGSGLKHLKTLTNLTELHLAHSNVDDSGLAHIETLTNLRLLGLAGTRVTNAGLSHLKGLNNLMRIDLPSVVDNSGVEHLKTLTNLRELILDDTQVSDEGLLYLKPLTKLSYLRLINTQVSDIGIKHLQQFTRLEVLHLSSTRVTDDGLDSLKPLQNLRELHLWSLRVGDTGLAKLQTLTNLQYLQIGRTQVSDAGLEYLKSLTKLTELHLYETQVSDKGLANLKVMTSLRKLGLNNTKVTTAGIRQLALDLPNCEIR